MFIDVWSLEIKQNKFRKFKPKAMMDLFFSLGQNIFFLQKAFWLFDLIIFPSLNIVPPCTTTANKTS